MINIYRKSKKWTFIAGLLFSSLFISPAHAQTSEVKPYQSQLTLVEGKLRAGQFPEALSLMDDILTQYPQADDIYFAKALVNAELRNLDEALANLDQAIAISENPHYLAYAVDIYKNKGDIPKALTYLDRLIAKSPEVSGNYREKMMLLQYNKEADKAIDLYQEVKQKFGETDTLDLLYADLLLADNKKGEAKKVLQKWIDQESPLRGIYTSLAQIYEQEGNKRGALLILEKALPLIKNDDYIFLDLADVYRINKRDKLAFEYLKKAFESMNVGFGDKSRILLSSFVNANGLTFPQIIELSNILTIKYPRVADAHVLKGQALWMNNQNSDARAQLLVAVGINPNHIDAWRMLMNVDLSLNEPDEALRHGTEALGINPNQSILLYFMGVANLIKEDYPGGRTFMEAALNNAQRENNFLQSNIYSSLGDIYHKLNMTAESDVAYREAISLDSTNVSALNNLAYYLSLRKEDLAFAAESAARANELRPNDPTFQDTYAWVLFQQQQYKEALIWIEKAIKLSKVPSAVLYEHYGDILSKNGKSAEAVKYWKLAIPNAQKEGINLEKLNQKINTKSYVE